MRILRLVPDRSEGKDPRARANGGVASDDNVRDELNVVPERDVITYD